MKLSRNEFTCKRRVKMPPLSYVNSKKGKPMLQHNGFLYYNEKTIDDTTFWKCIKYKSKLGRCAGRVTSKNKEVDIRTDHNHAGDMADAEARTVLQAIRKRSTGS